MNNAATIPSSNGFFERPILNSRYEISTRHRELEATVKPTHQIIGSRRRVAFITTIPNEESFFVRHAYFLGANDPYNALKATLLPEIDVEARATLSSYESPPFPKPQSSRITVKVINRLGD